MGRFGIGARVRDEDGDIGVIVGKSKGFREIEYDFGQGLAKGFRLGKRKCDLTLLDEAAAALTPWVPKVGDRVRPIGGSGARGEGRIIRLSSGGAHVRYDRWNNGHDGHTGDGSTNCWWDSLGSFEKVPEPAPLTIQAGRFYKTRDGRKVGPVSQDTRQNDVYPFTTPDRWWVKPNGVVNLGMGFDSKSDLVAEWVDEPTPPVETKPALKVGDRVRIVNHDKILGQNAGEWKDLPIGSEHTLTRKTRDGEGWILSGSKRHFWTDIQLELVPLSKGTLVSLTTTGKVSGVGGNGNINVVFPDLPAGRNSFALPASILAAA